MFRLGLELSAMVKARAKVRVRVRCWGYNKL